jgi:hypothetical protein
MAEVGGFENANGWTITAGAASKQSSAIHDEGASSLQLAARASLPYAGTPWQSRRR